MKIIQLLTPVVAAAFNKAGLPDNTPVILQPTKNPGFGDLQINGVMPAAKTLKVKPTELAAKVIAAFAPCELISELTIAGPGFINIRLHDGFLTRAAGQTLAADNLGIVKTLSGERVIIDYSSPNLAKEMHVGHLRSTIIGDSLRRIYTFMGAKVIAQNHVGDWGTQFGMLVAYLMEKEQSGKQQPEILLSDLEEFYREAKERFTTDPDFQNRARAAVVKLQHNDPEIMAYWRQFVQVSAAHIQAVYQRLHVLLTPADIAGESKYNGELAAVVNELLAKKIAVDDHGAKLVFLPEHCDAEGKPGAFIIQKQDGGFLYATTDLACLRQNITELKASQLLYVVDARQSWHFQALFAVAHAAGWLPAAVKARHIAFGTMMNTSGKPFKTRDGGTVKLNDLLDEAVSRARALALAKNPDLSGEELREITDKLAIGAVKYADLAKNRNSDYIFAWDKILSFEGNTAPYIQYAYTRIMSLLRKAGDWHGEAPAAREENCGAAEHNLTVMLLQFEEVLAQILATDQPHLLVNYLYQIATLFSRFYESTPILKAGDKLKNSRLALSALTGKTIKAGLNLLGIDVLNKM